VEVIAKEMGKAEENAEKLRWKETFALFHAGQLMSIVWFSEVFSLTPKKRVVACARESVSYS
jgi:hypothetical protein